MFDLIDWKKAPVGQPTPHLPEDGNAGGCHVLLCWGTMSQGSLSRFTLRTASP